MVRGERGAWPVLIQAMRSLDPLLYLTILFALSRSA
jgi:hypothetical protein